MAQFTGEIDLTNEHPMGSVESHMARNQAITDLKAALATAHGAGDFRCNVSDDLATGSWSYVTTE